SSPMSQDGRSRMVRFRQRYVVPVRHRDLPTGRARPQSLERNHVAVVAVRTAPNLQAQIREHDGLLRTSSGVPPTTSMPRSVKALRTGGSWTVAAVARCSVAVTSFGAPAGATSACQVVASKPGNPDSAMVGTSGNTAVRLSVVIASARIVPLWM